MRFLFNRRRKFASGRRRLRFESLERRNLLAQFIVTTSVDENDANPVQGPGLSLREAIGLANTSSGADTITFDASLFTGGDLTLTLTQFDTGLDTDEAGPTAFKITSEITIDGPSGNSGLTIARDTGNVDLFRLFHVTAAGNLTLDQVTRALGPRAGRLGELWDVWGLVRPLLATGLPTPA